MNERWPPVYDFEELGSQIAELVRTGELFYQFYERSQGGGHFPSDHLFAGDVLHLPRPVPVIDQEGNPVAKGSSDYWLTLSNSCDLSRELPDVPWALLAPIDQLPRQGVAPAEMHALEKYKPFRRFYLPPWNESVEEMVSVARFTNIISCHRLALSKYAGIAGRLTYRAWVLFHSCLVRFLARDDGRSEVL